MSEHQAPNDRLEHAIRELPRAVEPERDLWPAIQARIERRRGGAVHWWPAGLAAAAAVVFVLIAVQLAPSPDAPTGAAARAMAEIRGAEAEYIRAAERLSAVIERNQAALPAGSLSALQADIAAIDLAIERARAELARDSDTTRVALALSAMHRAKLALLGEATRRMPIEAPAPAGSTEGD